MAKILQTYSLQKHVFLGDVIFRLLEVSVGSTLTVLAKSLKTVFDEVHFIVNLLYQNSIRK